MAVTAVINKKLVTDDGQLQAVVTFTVTPPGKVMKVAFRTVDPPTPDWIHLQIADYITRINRVQAAHAEITLGPYTAP